MACWDWCAVALTGLLRGELLLEDTPSGWIKSGPSSTDPMDEKKWRLTVGEPPELRHRRRWSARRRRYEASPEAVWAPEDAAKLGRASPSDSGLGGGLCCRGRAIWRRSSSGDLRLHGVALPLRPQTQ